MSHHFRFATLTCEASRASWGLRRSLWDLLLFFILFIGTWETGDAGWIVAHLGGSGGVQSLNAENAWEKEFTAARHLWKTSLKN